MFQRLKFRAMGSDMLAVVDQASDSAPETLTQVPGWFEEWEQTLSRFRADSELSRLNQTFDRPMPVSQTLWDVFETSQWAERYSNGLVTPTVFDAMLEAGYDRSFDDLPNYQSHSMMVAPVIPKPLSIVIADDAARARSVYLKACILTLEAWQKAGPRIKRWDGCRNMVPRW